MLFVCNLLVQHNFVDFVIELICCYYYICLFIPLHVWPNWHHVEMFLSRTQKKTMQFCAHHVRFWSSNCVFFVWRLPKQTKCYRHNNSLVCIKKNPCENRTLKTKREKPTKNQTRSLRPYKHIHTKNARTSTTNIHNDIESFNCYCHCIWFVCTNIE